MKAKVSSLSPTMSKRLEEQRNWVRGHFVNNADLEYQKFDEKLKLLDIIIKSNWINKDEKYKLQCLGVTLGDLFVQDLDFNWIEIEDDSGIDPAIKYKSTTLILFPLTMISKRIENDEPVDIYELYNKMKKKVLGLKDKVD